MASVPMSRSGNWQYTSGDAASGYSTGEAFVAASGGATIDSLTIQHVHGFSSLAAGGSDRWVQFFEAAPNAGDVPLVSILVYADGSFSWSPPFPGWNAGAAFQWAVSSTGDLYTASADEFWVNAQGSAQVDSN